MQPLSNFRGNLMWVNGSLHRTKFALRPNKNILESIVNWGGLSDLIDIHVDVILIYQAPWCGVALPKMALL